MPKTKKSNKTLLMMGALLIIFALVLGGCMKKEPTVIEDKQVIEYGTDLTDQTFMLTHEDEDLEIDFTGLDPEVDTMELGETEHSFEHDRKQFLITLLIEDTEMPVMNGVEDVITLTGETVDIEKELKERITAEDPVDGKLEVSFDIADGKDEHTYDVEAKAIDKNDNETLENFEVHVEIKVVKEETKKEDIPFETINKDDAGLTKGTTKVSVEGENGSKEVTYEVTYINDEEESRKKAKEEIIKKPKDKVVLNGTKAVASSGTQSNTNTSSSSNSSTSSNSGSNNTQEKPKGESKPKPKPESKPKPSVQGPPGSTLTGNPADGVYEFSYNDNSLPGGGKITQVVVVGNGAAVIGIDKDGVQFGYSYSDNSFAFVKPNLSNEAISKVQSVASKFANSVK